jgi:hypothetical protein
MGETFLGVILWAEKDGIRGCVGDTGGQSWLFREFVLSKSREQIAVYQDGWRPKVSIQTNPKTSKEFVVTEPEIVEFSIEFFRSGGYKILSIAAATRVSTQDAETLNLVRERFEMAKRAERKARYERRESAPRELRFRTRKYERV